MPKQKNCALVRTARHGRGTLRQFYLGAPNSRTATISNGLSHRSSVRRQLRKVESASSLALQFTILTAARSGEVRGARWDEIDMDGKVWTIPASRMKAGVEHRVPRSDAAVEILEELAAHRCSDFVFPGQRHHQPILTVRPCMA
jgi:integrase